jgi:hypothetical protein
MMNQNRILILFSSLIEIELQKSSKNCEQFNSLLSLTPHDVLRRNEKEKGSPPQSSLNISPSRLSLSLIWLALFAYHLTARLRIKYSAFSMKMNMYVRTLGESLFFRVQ